MLHHFNFRGAPNDRDFNMIRNALNEIGGPLVAGKIETSIIEEKHRFLSGCALAIRELFFNRGGFDAN